MTKSLDILTSFLQVSAWLAESLELDQLLPALMQSAIELVPSADSGSLFLYNETTNLLEVRAAYNYGSDVVGLKLPIDSGVAGWVFKNNQPTIVDNFFLDSRTHLFPNQSEIAPIKSMVDAPLCVKNKVIGVISFDNLSYCNAFNEKDLRVVRFFANNAAIAIERARLYEDLKKQNQQLQILYQQAQEASRLRTEFLNCATHELRTPLCAIIGFAELLINSQIEQVTDRHRDWFKIIYKSGQDTLSLVNNILDLSALLSGKVSLYPQIFSLPSLLDNAITQARTWAKDKTIDINYSIAQNFPPIYLDPNKIQQIILGLLSNAVKFTSEGKIFVEVKLIDREVFSIAISDTGIGIKPEHLNLIFDEFGRVDNSTTRDYNGLGIGLSITKRLCQLMQGNISLESTYGAGSTFTITLPIRSTEITLDNPIN
ncbi:MAG: GAF domain-containing sensor histidine kinase [Acidobacteria bacterium]|nr:GAF domain-containing sensor histidine kinase [Acidobacteriota bacterium]